MTVFRENKLFAFYTGLVVLIVLLAIFAPYLAPQDPMAGNMKLVLQTPSAEQSHSGTRRRSLTVSETVQSCSPSWTSAVSRSGAPMSKRACGNSSSPRFSCSSVKLTLNLST